jgi:membrane protein implicated in regulation of membrane protease activity
LLVCARSQVKLGTEDWSAHAADDVEGVPSGTTVEVAGLEGVTALVRRVPA